MDSPRVLRLAPRSGPSVSAPAAGAPREEVRFVVHFDRVSKSTSPLWTLGAIARFMLVLVDYDNIHQIHRMRGLAYIGQRIAELIGATALRAHPRLDLRVYGGWFDGALSTRNAQRVAAEVAATPVTAHVSDKPKNLAVLVSARLALGPVDEPRLVLTHTYRRRAIAAGLVCKPAPFSTCAFQTACVLSEMVSFVGGGACTATGCRITPPDVFERAEQKMVDTLLVADLLSEARRGANAVSVVSTDDDMWPGVRTALSWGTTVYHVHPVPGRSTPTHFLTGLPARYHQATMS